MTHSPKMRIQYFSTLYTMLKECSRRTWKASVNGQQAARFLPTGFRVFRLGKLCGLDQTLTIARREVAPAGRHRPGRGATSSRDLIPRQASIWRTLAGRALP